MAYGDYEDYDDTDREAMDRMMRRKPRMGADPSFAPGEPTPGAPTDVGEVGETFRPTGQDRPVSAKSPSMSHRDYVQGLLKDQAYGPQGLANIEKQLNERGITLQKDSGGRVRGRIFMPDGNAVDLPGAGEGNDWWSNPTAGGWGWTERGQGSGGGGGSYMPGATAEPTTDPYGRPTSLVDPSFFKEIMRQLQERGGGTDRATLERMWK